VPGVLDAWTWVSSAIPAVFRPGNMCQVRIVRAGRWVYDGIVDRPVDIVALEFDFWHEVGAADGTLGEGEEPTPLGADRALYYVRFRRAGDPGLPTWVDSRGFGTLAEALREAEAKAPSPIIWSGA
jgi:hypothetical protein